jgi:glucose-6-phosphate 1-dehydrogenase
MQKLNDCTIVIFGASGDLAARKLIPALANLCQRNLLPANSLIVGCARREWDYHQFKEHIEKALTSTADRQNTEPCARNLRARMKYYRLNVDDSVAFGSFDETLTQWENELELPGNRLYYLAVGPEHIESIVMNLGTQGMLKEHSSQWRRIIIEKPFGHDLDSARALNRTILTRAAEKQIYRIDHYLGKETVQNILVFRFANGIFEPLWNRNYIDHIQITVAEDIGVGSRGEYYDSAGALRDMVPNHICQLMSLVAMEPPSSFDANAVRNEQTKAIQSVQTLTRNDVLKNSVRGQYGRGRAEGDTRNSYRETHGVDSSSNTETFVAARLFIDNWRWAGVPFYFRTGKRLPLRTTEIVIQFKQAPHKLFRHTNVDQILPNRLIMGIQPIEGIFLSIGAKIPGPIVDIGRVNMRFQYADYFGSRPDTGYERLLYDAILGDATLFQRADMVEAGWNFVMPILNEWSTHPADTFPNYTSGEWGPAEAEQLMARDGRSWEICSDSC